MKKALFILMAAVLVALPSFTSAGFSSSGAMLLTRLEVSKDGTTWVNYLAETNSGGQTLTVSPGDTIYFRLKTWNTGGTPAINIEYSAAYTNPGGVDAFDPFHPGVSDDSDGDAILFYVLNAPPDLTAGTTAFHLDGVADSTTETTGFQSGGMAAHIATSTPDQTVLLATVTITGADEFIVWWKNLLFPRALADDAATTQARILVATPAPVPVPVVLPATGPDVSGLLLLPVSCLNR